MVFIACGFRLSFFEVGGCGFMVVGLVLPCLGVVSCRCFVVFCVRGWLFWGLLLNMLSCCVVTGVDVVWR